MTKKGLKMPVEVKGIVEAQKALKKFAPDLYKEMNKEIRLAMKKVVDDARQLLRPQGEQTLTEIVTARVITQMQGRILTGLFKALTAVLRVLVAAELTKVDCCLRLLLKIKDKSPTQHSRQSILPLQSLIQALRGESG